MNNASLPLATLPAENFELVARFTGVPDLISLAGTAHALHRSVRPFLGRVLVLTATKTTHESFRVLEFPPIVQSAASCVLVAQKSVESVL